MNSILHYVYMHIWCYVIILAHQRLVAEVKNLAFVRGKAKPSG